MGQDFKGDHLELMKDINKNMKDFVIKVFAKRMRKLEDVPSEGISCMEMPA